MQRGLHRVRMGLMAYFHDFAEYKLPDYTPHDDISANDKHRLERITLENLLRGTGLEGKLILELWHEYEQQKTPGAQMVLQLDKLDAAIQALVYEKQGYDVAEFFPYTMKKLTDAKLIRIFSDLLETRNSEINFYSVYFAQLNQSH